MARVSLMEMSNMNLSQEQMQAEFEKNHRADKRKTLIFKIIIVVSLLAWFMISVFPLFWAFLTSVKPTIDAFTAPPVWVFEPTFEFYRELIVEEEFFFYMRNSLIVAVSSVALALLVGLPCGYALSRYGGSSSFNLLALALVFRSLPGMVFVIPYYYIAQQLGIHDTQILLTMVVVAMNQPFTVWTLRSFFLTIPQSLDEAAMVDGRTRFRAFIEVVVPIIGPGVATSSIFTLLTAYNEYLISSALTSTKAVTLPVLIATYGADDLRYWSISAAGSIMMAVPFILLVILFQKQLVQGMGNGAVKE